MRLAAKTLALCVLVLTLHASTWAQEGAPTQEQVQTALEQVRNDPLWSHKEKEHVLRFKPRLADKSKTGEADNTDTPQWATSISEAARYLMWGFGIACVAWVLVALRRWVRVRGEGQLPTSELPPSHISHLDIRPQSLPQHIGDAVAALWREGQHRQALSLLYRGTLSRLVHQHAVPIRAASTEDECAALASARLDSERGLFVRQLITVWQRATYGSQLPSTDALEQLCHGFGRLLDTPATPEARP